MKVKIGVSMIVVGLLISVINPFYVLFVGIPVFILGVIILWLSKSSKKTKALWTIVPPIAWYPLAAIWLLIYNAFGMANAQKRDYYVNYDFKGTITVAESKCGKEPVLKDKRLQFEIPSNGVYLHNGELKSGYINERVFIRNKNGSITKMEDENMLTGDVAKDTTGNEVIVGSGYVSFGVNYKPNNQEYNVISRHIETNKIYSQDEQWRKDRRIKNILDSLIINCEK